MSSVSCIIVSYNNEPYLEKAVTSVLEQTHSVDEIIIADDASTDHSREIIQRLADKHSNIRPIYRECNLGPAANRDLAAKEAIGEYISFLDGDDWYYPEKIEKELAECISSPNTVSFSSVNLVRDDGTIIESWDMSKFPNDDVKQRLHWLVCRKRPIPTHMMLPKKLYLESGGFNPKYRLYEDWDFKIRLASLPSKWRHTGATGYAYRRGHESLSSINLFKVALGRYLILRKNKATIYQCLGFKGYIESLYRIFIRYKKKRKIL